jgi:adenosylmethionine-8-amino-7-oxononanoate aminotransferase
MKTTFNANDPYYVWNPFTPMESFEKILGFGPTIIVEGQGAIVKDLQGNEYINGMSSLWNTGIGHGRSEVAAAVAAQLEKLHYATLFTGAHLPAMELAEKLVTLMEHHFHRVFFTSNGSESVETALKMSRQFFRQSPNIDEKSRYKIISLNRAYHGVSYGALSASGLIEDQEKFTPLVPGFIKIEPPYCYRCPYNSKYPDCHLLCAKALESKILEEIPSTVAAFIMEPILGVGGILVPPLPYYQEIAQICQKYGLLLIMDEVTTGFGRTGDLFAYMGCEVKPDILCLGKIISSGYLPLGATLATKRIFERFLGPRENKFNHGSTASGHPACCVAGLKNIEIIEREKLVDNSKKIGKYLMERVCDLQKKRPFIGDVRGKGLMVGIELVHDQVSKVPFSQDEILKIMLGCHSSGLLLYRTNNTLALFPPLIFDEKLVDRTVAILDEVLTKCT